MNNISIKYKYTETIKVLADNISDHGFPDFQLSKMFCLASCSFSIGVFF